MAAKLILVIDSDNDGIADDRIVFDPKDQNGGFTLIPFPPFFIFLPDQCAVDECVVANTWQTWDARNGLWEADSSSGTLMTFDQYVSAHPNARIVNEGSTIGGVQLAAGGSEAEWVAFSGNVDGFQIAFNAGTTTTFDFEPNASSSSSSSSSSSVSSDGTGGAGGGRGGGGGGRRPVSSVPSGGNNSVPGGGFGGNDEPLPFDDVPSGSFYEDAVRWLLENDYIDSANMFRPGAFANRAETAKLLIEVMGGPLSTDFSGTSFDDVRAGTWYYVYFEDGGERGWIRGDRNCYGLHPCTGRPADTIIRAEIAALIVRAFAMPHTGEAPQASDVLSGQWYTQYMTTAADHCVIRGDAGTGRMRPLQAINRGEIAVMMYRAWLDREYDNGCSDIPRSSSSSSRSSMQSSRSSFSSSMSSMSSSMSSLSSFISSSFSNSSMSSGMSSSSSI